MAIHLSVSSMADYAICEKKYWYRIKRSDASIPSVHMIFGKIVHKAIERYAKTQRPLEKLVGWSLHEWDRQTEAKASFLGSRPKPPQNFKKQYSNYIENIYPQLSAGEAEKRFKILLDKNRNIYFVGKIDWVEDTAIYDWKTGSSIPDRSSLSDNQFFGYWWAFNRLYDKPLERILYGHLATGTLYNVNMSRYLLDNFQNVLDKSAEKVYNAWESGIFTRNIGYHCKSCPFIAICYREMDEESNVADS